MKSCGWVRALGRAAVLTAASASAVQGGTCVLPGWAAGAPLGTGVLGAGVTSAGGLVYVASGYNTALGSNVNQFRSYNPSTNAWTTLANVPTPVAGALLAHDAAGGRLFLFGGTDNAPIPTFFTMVQVYNIGTNTWSAGPNMSLGRANMGGGVIGNMVHLVGGVTGFPPSALAQHVRFDPGPGTYSSLANLPTARALPGSGVSGGRLYIMGGRTSAGGGASSTNYEYTPATNTWATLASLPTAVDAPGATALSGDASCNADLIVVGGAATGVSQLYNVATNGWSSGPTLPTARSFLGAAQAGNTLIAVAGFDGAASVATVDRIQGPPLPVSVGGFSVE